MIPSPRTPNWPQTSGAWTRATPHSTFCTLGSSVPGSGVGICHAPSALRESTSARAANSRINRSSLVVTLIVLTIQNDFTAAPRSERRAKIGCCVRFAASFNVSTTRSPRVTQFAIPAADLVSACSFITTKNETFPFVLRSVKTLASMFCGLACDCAQVTESEAETATRNASIRNFFKNTASSLWPEQRQDHVAGCRRFSGLRASEVKQYFHLLDHRTNSR